MLFLVRHLIFRTSKIPYYFVSYFLRKNLAPSIFVSVKYLRENMKNLKTQIRNIIVLNWIFSRCLEIGVLLQPFKHTKRCNLNPKIRGISEKYSDRTEPNWIIFNLTPVVVTFNRFNFAFVIHYNLGQIRIKWKFIKPLNFVL